MQSSTTTTATVVVGVLLAMASSFRPCSSFSIHEKTSPLLHLHSLLHTTTTTKTVASSTALYMGKGLSKSKNKQADLKRKLELAKQQNNEGTTTTSSTEWTDEQEATTALTAEQIKERNDRKRLEQLLKRDGAKSFANYDTDGYLSRNQEEEEITAARSGVDRIFEGDPAPTDCFENLVDSNTGNKVAKKGAGRLAPWISNDLSIDENDYRVVVCDPRKQSMGFHQAITDSYGGLPKDIKDRLYFINSDTPAENRRWMKKTGMLNNVDIYCDTEDMDWMKSYSALGENRWSMTMFILRRGKVAKLARDLDIYNCSKTIINAVKSMKNDQIG